MPELLVTFGLSYVLLELVQLIWGRTSVPFSPPPALQGPAFTLVQSSAESMRFVLGVAPEAMCKGAADVVVQCSRFPLNRAFLAGVALFMLLALWLLLTRTRIGLVIQAALTHPEMVESLGHNVPRVFMLVFGAGCALAGLAGVIGGITFVTEPTMAPTVGLDHLRRGRGRRHGLAGRRLRRLAADRPAADLPLTVDKSLRRRSASAWAGRSGPTARLPARRRSRCRRSRRSCPTCCWC